MKLYNEIENMSGSLYSYHRLCTCIMARCDLYMYSGYYQVFLLLSFEANGVADFLLLTIPIVINNKGNVVK